MRIELWTDIVCPWCGLGSRRLDTALERFEHGDEVELVRRSFQLDESLPVGETVSVRAMLRTKKGMTDAQIDDGVRRIERLAEAEGLVPYVVRENRVGHTGLAHQLAAWATEQGRGEELWRALYRAYFGEARSIFDVDSLVALAAELGLDAEAAREALRSGRYAAQVQADGRRARELGVSGVPFFLIDERYAVSGAQPVDLLVQALETAWAERRPTTSAAADEAEACGPDGCALPSKG